MSRSDHDDHEYLSQGWLFNAEAHELLDAADMLFRRAMQLDPDAVRRYALKELKEIDELLGES
jgi:hypothetical protein